jgi:hypothetical protein
MGTLMLAERSMTNDNSVGAHMSRALEYSFNGAAWVLANPAAYKIGTFGAGQPSSAGGVDFDFSPGGRVWVSGDALHFNPTLPDLIYGIQGLPYGGGDITNSILIDDDNDISQQPKRRIGVVRIPCPECANPPLPPVVLGRMNTSVSPSHYAITPQQFGVTYTWAVTGGTLIGSNTGSSVDVNWTGTAGSITVTASGPGSCGFVSTFVSLGAALATEVGGTPTNINLPKTVPLVLPDGSTLAVPEGSILIPLLAFVKDAGDTAAPKHFVVDGIKFEPSNAVVMENSVAMLNNLAAVLKAYPAIAIRLEGYTDNSGDAATKQRASLARAEAVRAVLQRAGVAVDRITVDGRGSENPIASNDTEEGRARNNRIELVVVRK